MSEPDLHVVIGALGYSGRHIAQALLQRGCRVRSLTGHPGNADPFGGRVELRPLPFQDEEALRQSLVGARVLYNTYWLRFDYRGEGFEQGVQRNLALLRAARRAGVRRLVHTSITQPSLDSPLPYFAGKAKVESAIHQSGLSYAILRPAVFFGGRDVLINNIAWLLRRLPVFGVPGDGSYGVQPIHVRDFASLALQQGEADEDVVLDAVGPETWSYAELVRLVARHVGSRARIVHLPPWMVLLAARLLGRLVGDVVLTSDEIRGLMGGLLVSHGPATGTTRLSEWLEAHGDDLGREYANELRRHYRAQ